MLWYTNRGDTACLRQTGLLLLAGFNAAVHTCPVFLTTSRSLKRLDWNMVHVRCEEVQTLTVRGPSLVRFIYWRSRVVIGCFVCSVGHMTCCSRWVWPTTLFILVQNVIMGWLTVCLLHPDGITTCKKNKTKLKHGGNRKLEDNSMIQFGENSLSEKISQRQITSPFPTWLDNQISPFKCHFFREHDGARKCKWS